jgi:hypothetical protein
LNQGAIVVLDVGKTLSKLTLWEQGGTLIERRTRPNEPVRHDGLTVLDTAGIENWLAETLRDFARLANIAAIVPVAHGAALAILRNGRLVAPPLDYEHAMPEGVRREYEAQRDPFAETGSPSLPGGLNLGTQLHLLDARDPSVLEGATILPWPQYWAWLLSGVAASEVTSLGCHSDLWSAKNNAPSPLAAKRGWAARFAPMRHAADVLGPITSQWSSRTGLPATVKILCGLHDSNAALLAARGFPEIAEHEATILSTGTWFVAMRSPNGDSGFSAKLSEQRDCLINIDANGNPVPSARWMGGREAETLLGVDTRNRNLEADRDVLLNSLPRVLSDEIMLLPSFVSGSGPFPESIGRWLHAEPQELFFRRAAIYLYLALVTDVSLGLIGACERVLIEGRFAEADLFTRALATLRPDTEFYVANAHNDVSYGARRLLQPDLPPSSVLLRVSPLPFDMTRYKQRWLEEADRVSCAA